MSETTTLEVERRMAGPPDLVFAHFTDPELHLRWSGTSVRLDPRPGGAYVVSFGEHGEIRGEYAELDPPRRLVLLWGWSDKGGTSMSPVTPSSTRVEIDFVPDGDGTIVRLRQTGIPAVAVSAITWGWKTYLERIAEAVEGAAPAADPFGTMGTAALEINPPS